MWSYIIEVQICWLLLYGFFWASLRKETYFFANRWYLMTTLILGLIIPFVKLSQSGLESAAEGVAFELPLVQVGIESISFAHFSWLDLELLWKIYWFGASLALIKVFIGLMGIYRMVQEGRLTRYRGYTLVQASEVVTPFSFFQYLFVSDKEDLTSRDTEAIVTHEMVHIKSWHSADRMILEVLGVFFWFSPLIYFFKNSIRDVHEFEADASAVKTTELVSYGELLLRYNQVASTATPALSNPLMRTQLKKRFIMMTRKPSNHISLIKYLLVVPLLLLSLFVLSCRDNIDLERNTAFDTLDKSEINSDGSHAKDQDKVVSYEDFLNVPDSSSLERIDQIPVFGSGDKDDLLNYFKDNIKYPELARQHKVEGTVIIQFVVETDGSIRSATVVNSIGSGCDEEALRVINGMPKWTAGVKNGVEVPVQFTIPVMFKLS